MTDQPFRYDGPLLPAKSVGMQFMCAASRPITWAENNRGPVRWQDIKVVS